MTAPSIAVVDYGMGNRRSVEKALERVGARAQVTADHGALRAADGLVLPGVGAFPQAMRNLAQLGLDQLLVERMGAGTPLLGVCLGMQLLFDGSVEMDGADGLGLIPGTVERLDPGDGKLPHIGWSQVTWRRPAPLTEDLPQPCAFYHVHSFAPHPADADDVLGVAEYAGAFVTAVDASRRAGAPLFGVQFHPEKSSADGLRLLGNFAAVCARVAA